MRFKVTASLMLALGALAAAGCSSTPPDEVVRSYMQALAAFDASAMAAQACPEVSQAIMERSEQVTMAGETGMEISVSDLNYEVVVEEEAAAVVRVTGTARFAGVDEPVDEDLRLVLVDDQWRLCEEFK